MSAGYLDWQDEAYPEPLRRIKDAPKRLYYDGDLSLLKSRMVAVVGSRRVTAYGRRIASRIATRLATCGVTVVSGMAMGIDGISHRSALEADGGTVAVLGCGVDVLYPKSHRELRDDIVRRGLLLSEYPPGTHATPFTFPQRNRIISGLAEATVVVEAGISSGSLITANFANEQGRAVYAVPGNIDSVYSLGTNLLIRDGAIPLVEVEDLLLDMKVDRTPLLSAKNEDIGEEETALLRILAQGGERTMDELAEALGCSAARAGGLVSVLEIKGLAATALGRVFLIT